MRFSSVRLASPFVGLALAAPDLSAQTLFTFDQIAGSVLEFHGSVDPCGNAIPSLKNAFAPDTSCGGSLSGSDVAYDAANDLLFYADNTHVSVHAADGAYAYSFTSPLPIRGMGCDAAAQLLWATDGFSAFALAIPGAGCASGTVATLASPSVPIPGPGLWLDVDWDPGTGSLFACGVLGNVVNFGTSGALGTFGIYAIPTCSGNPFGLKGIAVDTTSILDPGLGHVYVSDGFNVGSYLPGGVPTLPGTLSLTAACTPMPVATPTRGLAFAPRGVAFGIGVDPDGLAAPVGTQRGACVIPNMNFGFELEQADPTGIGYLVLSESAACPPYAYPGGVLVYTAFNVNYAGTFDIVPVAPDGTASASVPIGAGTPSSWAYGRSFVAQWLILKPFGPSTFQTSNAILFRFGIL
ncbi:MAG: hypothetical protein GY711_19295 [bacterium]|nr:hypothetical protein [bacterium]